MRRLRFTVAVFIALLGTVFGSTFSTVAQEASPVAGPAGCDGPPRTADELLDLWFSTTLAPEGSPEADEAINEVVIPVGERIDVATAVSIDATVNAVFACLNAGDFLRATAFFTDELASEFGPGFGSTREEAAAFLAAPPAPAPPGEEAQIVAVSNVMRLADGRIGAFVIAQTGDEFDTSYAMFKEIDGSWLVDQVIEFPPSGEGA